MKIVVSARNGTRHFECAPGEKILHAGLRSAIELPYECGTGTCGTCKARLVSGCVESAWPEAPGRRYLKSEAELLMCQSVAGEDCALEIGAPLDFAAGQFALLTVPGIEGARAYSMVNFDRPAGRLSFVVKKKPGGAVSEWLFGSTVDGTRLAVFAPLGHATFEPGLRKHLLCVAGGSGIAGMMSILARACRAEHFAAWDGHVFFGVRTARDGFFLDELETFRARCGDRLAITVALSDEDVPESLAAAHPGFGFARGFVHAVAGERMQGRFADVRAYVAGPPPMVDASLRWLLREARLPPAEIRYDKFS
jgi:toluene monooxygenase electron transfer component